MRHHAGRFSATGAWKQKTNAPTKKKLHILRSQFVRLAFFPQKCTKKKKGSNFIKLPLKKLFLRSLQVQGIQFAVCTFWEGRSENVGQKGGISGEAYISVGDKVSNYT